MERLKEYAGVIAAAVTVFASLAALGLWAINAQVTPEINRLDGRIDNYQSLYTEINGRLGRMDGRFDRLDDRFDRMEKRLERRFDRIDDRFKQMDDRFKQIDVRFVQLESRINRRFDDMAAAMNAILARFPVPANPENQ